MDGMAPDAKIGDYSYNPPTPYTLPYIALEYVHIYIRNNYVCIEIHIYMYFKM
jgi:hypothetical protein